MQAGTRLEPAKVRVEMLQHAVKAGVQDRDRRLMRRGHPTVRTIRGKVPLGPRHGQAGSARSADALRTAQRRAGLHASRGRARYRRLGRLSRSHLPIRAATETFVTAFGRPASSHARFPTSTAFSIEYAWCPRWAAPASLHLQIPASHTRRQPHTSRHRITVSAAQPAPHSGPTNALDIRVRR